jgi:hypothetical protein
LKKLRQGGHQRREAARAEETRLWTDKMEKKMLEENRTGSDNDKLRKMEGNQE